jgi:hypothetical protein
MYWKVIVTKRKYLKIINDVLEANAHSPITVAADGATSK